MNEHIPNRDILPVMIELENSITDQCIQLLETWEDHIELVRYTNPRITKIVDTFEKTYLRDEDGEIVLNKEPIRNLAEFIISNFNILSEEDIDIAVENALEGLFDGASTYFYIPLREFNKADFASPISTTSNEYMIKLVMEKAAQKNIKINVITESTIPRDIKEIRLIDDASYSGRQISTVLNNLFRSDSGSETYKNRANVKVYLAGINYYGCEYMQNNAYKNKSSGVEFFNAKRIPSIFELTFKTPEISSFFAMMSIATTAKYNMHVIRINWKEGGKQIMHSVERSLESLTLTRTFFGVPDFSSVPEFVRQGFNSLTKKYPLINTNFREGKFTIHQPTSEDPSQNEL